MTNPGDQRPYGDDYLVRRMDDFETRLREGLAARSLAASQIGNGGTLQVDGDLVVNGTLSAPAGTFDTAGSVTAGTSVSAGTTISAGGAITGASVAVTGAATAASVSATGAVSAASVSATGTVTGTAGITSVGAYNLDITYTRRGGWWGNDGRAGYASSSIRHKTEIAESDIDPLAVLQIGVKHYRYIAEVRKRDDPTYEGYVGPHYHVALEAGMIAEDLHAAGLWQFVVYARDLVRIDGPYDDREQSEEMYESVTVERLRLDERGEPIPQSIHYELWSMAVLVATKHVWTEHLALENRVKALEGR